MSHETHKISPAQVLEKYQVSNFKELSRFYSERDQEIMKAGKWDYGDDSLITNEIVNLLRLCDTSHLLEEDRDWYQEVMWFWNHHAISCAIWRYQDIEAAKLYAEKALEFQSKDHPNQITQLFYLLLSGKEEEAKEYIKSVSVEEEETAEYLLRSYESGWKERV